MREGQYALILGASSGFGAATALELARVGWNIFGVHLDRRSGMPAVEQLISDIKALGRDAVFFNVNAADEGKRQEVISGIKARTEGQADGTPVGVLLHSLAFGTLKPFTGSKAADRVSKAQIEMTLDVMANSLIYWVQDLLENGLLGQGGRIFAMTSAGSTRVMPSYGPVSAAKATLESHIRQLALELAPQGITANAIRAGITDTPSFRRIPGADRLAEMATSHNPSGRMTTTADVAACIAALCDPRTYWMTGNVIGVDGGEDITG